MKEGAGTIFEFSVVNIESEQREWSRKAFDLTVKHPLKSVMREWRNWQTCLPAGRRAK
jgi:hypothetical protein